MGALAKKNAAREVPHSVITWPKASSVCRRNDKVFPGRSQRLRGPGTKPRDLVVVVEKEEGPTDHAPIWDDFHAHYARGAQVYPFKLQPRPPSHSHKIPTLGAAMSSSSPGNGALGYDIEMLAVGDVADRQKHGSTGPTPESESDDDEFDVDNGERGLLQGHEAGTPRKDYASGSRLANLWHQVKSIVVEVSEQFPFIRPSTCMYCRRDVASVGMGRGTRRKVFMCQIFACVH